MTKYFQKWDFINFYTSVWYSAALKNREALRKKNIEPRLEAVSAVLHAVLIQPTCPASFLDLLHL